eukprot:8373152-Prorocentrum_lima.AAC.1
MEASSRISEKENALSQFERRWNQEVEESRKSKTTKDEEVRLSRHEVAEGVSESVVAARRAA